MLAGKTWVAMLQFFWMGEKQKCQLCPPFLLLFLAFLLILLFLPGIAQMCHLRNDGSFSDSPILCGQSQVKHQNAGGKPCRTTSGRQASQHPAAKARKERLRHTQTAWQWRAERASGRRPVLPNVAFWSYEKLAIFLLLPLLSPDHCPIQKLYLIQKLRFRNYDSETIARDSEITILKLYFVWFRNYDSETISCDSEATILKLFRAIQKPGFWNYFVRFRKTTILKSWTTRSYLHIPLQNCHPLWQRHAFLCWSTSTSNFLSPLDNTFILTIFHSTPSGKYMHFHVHEQARLNSDPLWATRSYLHYTTSKLQPPLADTYISRLWTSTSNLPLPLDNTFIEGSLEVKLPTIWTDEKQSREEAERRERFEERRVRRKNMQMREKVGKSRNTVFFQWFGAPEGRKVGSLKRRVRSQLARWEMKKCTPLWREAHLQVKMYKTHHSRTTFGSWDVEKVHAVVARSTFRSENVLKHTILGPLLEVEMSKKCTPLWREAHLQVKMYKTHHSRTTFGSWDVQKVHAVVARSTFASQNVQNTPFSDHFWKLRCPESARRCGAKHISKSKCTKHTSSGPLLEVEMSKKCTPLWREAHFQVKMLNTLGVRTTFGSSDLEKVHAVVARSTFPSQNVQNTPAPDHFWKLRCRKSARRCGAKHISKWKCTKH